MKSFLSKENLRDPSNVITSIRSEHNGYYEDHRFKFDCQPSNNVVRNVLTGQCAWSGWVNSYDAPFTYNCKDKGAILGIHSLHDDYYDDRRFNILCCPVKPTSNAGLNCLPYPSAGWINSYDGFFHLSAPEGAHINGIQSQHDSYYE